MKNQKEPEELLKVIKNSTANVWQHIHFNGTYDFSDEIFADSFNLLHSQNYEIEWDCIAYCETFYLYGYMIKLRLTSLVQMNDGICFERL